MSVLGCQTNISQDTYFFLRANVSTLTADSIQAKSISTIGFRASTIYADYAQINTVSTNYIDATTVSSFNIETDFAFISSAAVLAGNISSINTNNIILDGNTLDTGGVGTGAQLLLNGLPIATGGQFSTLADWSYYPAVSTLQMNNQRLSNAENIYAQNITLTQNTKTDTLTVDTSMTAGTANITNLRATNLSSTQINASNINIISSLSTGGTLTVGGRGIFLTSISTPAISTNNILARNNIVAFNSVQGNLIGANFMVASNIQAITKFEGGDAGVRNLTASTINVSTINGGTDYHSSNWSQYPARSQINTAGNTIYGSNNLVMTGLSNVNITAEYEDITLQGGLSGLASGNVNVNGGDVNLTADEGLRVDLYSDINLVAQNGNRGRINLTAEPGYLATNFGEINLVANPGSIGGVGYGGLITLTANSLIGTPSNLTSAIKINAASCLIYSGISAPLASLAGFNYFYGTGGNSIVAGTPPVLPQVPGTNYIWGEFGTTIQNGLYADIIYPNFTIAGQDLTIRGRTLPYSAGVRLSNVKSIYMDSPGLISNVGSNYGTLCSYTNGGFNTLLTNFATIAELTALGGGYNSFISGFCNITGCNLNTNSINNIAISNYLNTSNFQTASISSLTVSSINGATPGGGGGGGSNFVAATISSLSVSSINNYVSFVADSNSQGFIVDGDAAAILLRNTNPGGQKTGLLLAADDNNALIQAFNTSNANPLNLYLFADNFGFNTSNIAGGYEVQIEGNTLISTGCITVNEGGFTSEWCGSNLQVSSISGVSFINSTRTQVLGEFLTTTTTTVSGVNTPTAIPFDTTTIANRISIVSGALEVQDTGLFEFKYSIQFDKSGGGTDEIDFWVRVNGFDVANTASKITITGTQAETLGTVISYLSLNSGDKVELIFASSDSTAAATYFPAWTTPGDPYDRPAIPAVIANLSLIK